MYPRRDAVSGLYGFWGTNAWVIEPQYDFACHFSSGYAEVRRVDQEFGLIGKDGTFYSVKEICTGRTLVSDEFFNGFVDFNEGESKYACVCTETRRGREWGLIDTNLVYKPLPLDSRLPLTNIRVYGEYLVLIHAEENSMRSSVGLFSILERRLELGLDFTCIYPSSESLWVVSRSVPDAVSNHHDMAFYDMERHAIVSGWYWGAIPFACGFGAINEDGGDWHFVDRTLRPAFDAEFDDVGRFSYGLAAVYKDEDAGYIDTTGRMRLLLPYDDLRPFNEFGLAFANRDRSDWDIDIIDRKGHARLSGLETAVYYEGDFPYFEISKDGDEHVYDAQLSRLY